MNPIRPYTQLLLFSLFLIFACNNQQENPRLVLAGESSKTWVVAPEAAEQEENIRLSERPEEKMVFYANGSFQIVNELPGQTGRWNYNSGQDQLEIVFDDQQEEKTVFHVQELEENMLVLHAEDGTTLRLKPE